MHPFLVHSASLNYSTEMRLAFNLGVRWRSDDSNALLDMGGLDDTHHRRWAAGPQRQVPAAWVNQDPMRSVSPTVAMQDAVLWG